MKDITKWLIPQPCAWEGCNRTGEYAAIVPPGNWQDAELYCKAHAIIVAWKDKEESDVRKEED